MLQVQVHKKLKTIFVVVILFHQAVAALESDGEAFRGNTILQYTALQLRKLGNLIQEGNMISYGLKDRLVQAKGKDTMSVSMLMAEDKDKPGVVLSSERLVPQTATISYLKGFPSSIEEDPSGHIRLGQNDPVAQLKVSNNFPVFSFPPCTCTPVAMIGIEQPVNSEESRKLRVNKGLEVSTSQKENAFCNHMESKGIYNPETKFSNTYHRYTRVTDSKGDMYEAHMYALYFEKDQTGGWNDRFCDIGIPETCGHKHDIESVLIFYKNDIPTHVGVSSHGDYKVEKWEDVPKTSGTHPHILYHQDTFDKETSWAPLPFLPWGGYMQIRRTHHFSFYRVGLRTCGHAGLLGPTNSMLENDLFVTEDYNFSPPIASWYYTPHNHQFRKTVNELQGSIISGAPFKDSLFGHYLRHESLSEHGLTSIPFFTEKSMGNCTNSNDKGYSYCFSKGSNIIDCANLANRVVDLAVSFEFGQDYCSIVSGKANETDLMCSRLNEFDASGETEWTSVMNGSAGGIETECFSI